MSIADATMPWLVRIVRPHLRDGSATVISAGRWGDAKTIAYAADFGTARARLRAALVRS